MRDAGGGHPVTTDNPARPDDEPVVLDADEVLDPAAVPLTDREPVIDRLRSAQRELLFKKHGMTRYRRRMPDDPEGQASGDVYWLGPNGLDETDIASMLEVAWLLGLDPFTPGEIWCSRAKPKPGETQGRLLVMVGRDGRRKIVQRNRLRMRGDVVRQEDDFEVWHSEEDGTPLKRIRVLHHFKGSAKDRGDIIGSWSEVWDPRTGETRGWFFAPVDEYDASATASYDNPWKHQKTAMMKAASERQSTSEATPLSGLIGEGEAEINQPPDRPVLGGDPAGEDRQIGQAVDVGALPAAVRDVLARAERLGHAGLAYAATAEMFTAGKPDEVVAAWVADAHTELDQFEQHHRPRPDPEPREDVAGDLVQQAREADDPDADEATAVDPAQESFLP
jgi:RecT family